MGDAKYNELVEFKRKYDHSRVPARWKDKALASWVLITRQRQRYKDNKNYGGSLSPAKTAKFEAIGFQWVVVKTAPTRMSWEVQYKELVGSHEKYGHGESMKTLVIGFQINASVTKEREEGRLCREMKLINLIH